MTSVRSDAQLWLSQFNVELSSASPFLYGNARQQAELRLTVETQPHQPPLTVAQLASLTLVLERPDGLYDPLPYGGAGTTPWWQAVERDTRFDLMPGTHTALPPSQGTSVASKMLYVSTTQAGGSNVKLRARIQKDANTFYYTDDAAGFDAYVILTTVRPPTFGENDYEWRKTVSEGSVDNVFLHEYSLRLNTLGFAPLSQLGVPGMIRWHRNESQETYATYVGMAEPGSKTVRYNDKINTGPWFTPSPTTKTPGSESLILVLNGADNIPYNRDGLDHGGPCSIMLVDRHGNDHQVLLRFSNDGTPLERRTHIALSYPARDGQPK